VDANYDSSADFWKLIKKEDGTYEFAWDGNLNIYDETGNAIDPEVGKLLGYTELTDVIKRNLGLDDNDTILLGGIDVKFGDLKTLQKYNTNIIKYALNEASTTAAAMALTDGFMSANEAREVGKEVWTRYQESGEGPNMIEHWSARYVLDEHKALAAAINNQIAAWINPFTAAAEDITFGIYNSEIPLSFYSDVFEENLTISMMLRTSFNSIFHGPFFGIDSYKWQTFTPGQGYELVFTDKGIENDPKYIGTYNWGIDTKDHKTLDVDPYSYWGNSPDDLSNWYNKRIKEKGELF
jgi:hypothetical protein